MSDMIANVSRRGFLKGMVSGWGAGSERAPGSGIMSGLSETGPGTDVDRAALHPSVFVGIDSDGTMYIVAHRSEMGTGSRTSLPLVLADELDADWKTGED